MRRTIRAWPVRRVEVMRGTHRDPGSLFGPLPGLRVGDVVAYEFELQERFEPWPGRTRLMLDLDEFADAMADGTLSLEDAVDALRRWQRFLDRYLHADRWPPAEWSDFPPASIRNLLELAAPIGEPVKWENGSAENPLKGA